jgi:AcrR family transcriptional regulator
MGLRELKKQKTRKAISDLATKLFLERGYDAVTTAEIAERAEVSVPTLFKYFPNKESLVFDEDDEIRQSVVNAVLNRKKNQSILDALFAFGLERIRDSSNYPKSGYSQFMGLVERTPALSLYAQQMWMRHEKALSEAIRKSSKRKVSKIEAEVIARFALDSFHRAMGEKDSEAALKTMFGVLKPKWL